MISSRGVARHRTFEAAQRLADDGLDVVVAAQQRANLLLRRPRRQQTDLEEDVLLGGKVEVEQPARNPPRRATDVGDGRLRIPVGAPEGHCGLHQAALGFVGTGALIGRAPLTTVSESSLLGARHSRTVTAQLTLANS